MHTVYELVQQGAPHLAVTIPNPDPAAPPGMAGVTTIIGWLKWIGYVVVGGAIIVGGIMIAVSLRRGEGQDSLSKILWPLAGAIVIGSGIAMVTALT